MKAAKAIGSSTKAVPMANSQTSRLVCLSINSQRSRVVTVPPPSSAGPLRRGSAPHVLRCSPARTRAINDVLTTMRPEYGGPVPIADLLDVAGRHASELISLDRSIVVPGNTIDRLKRIVDATEDEPRPRFSDDAEDSDWDW